MFSFSTHFRTQTALTSKNKTTQTPNAPQLFFHHFKNPQNTRIKQYLKCIIPRNIIRKV